MDMSQKATVALLDGNYCDLAAVTTSMQLGQRSFMMKL